MEEKKKSFWPKFSRRKKPEVSDDAEILEDDVVEAPVLDVVNDEPEPEFEPEPVLEEAVAKKKGFWPRLAWRSKSGKSNKAETDLDEPVEVEDLAPSEDTAETLLEPVAEIESEEAAKESSEDQGQEETSETPEDDVPPVEVIEEEPERVIPLPESPGGISVYMQEVLDEVQKKGEELRLDARKEAQQEATQIIERARVEANAILDQARADAPDAANQQAEIIVQEGRARAAQIEADATKEAQRLQEETKDNLSGYVQEVMD